MYCQVRLSRYGNLPFLMEGFSGAMHGVIQKLAVDWKRILGKAYIVDEQEVADGFLVLQLLRKEQS